MDVVGVYAAVVATASVGWQVMSHRKEESVRPELRVSYGIGVGMVPDLVIIKTVNRSTKHSIRVTAAGIGVQDGRDGYLPVLYPLPGYELNVDIGPMDARETAMPVVALAEHGIDLRRPIVARAHLATGEWVYSKPTTLLAA